MKILKFLGILILAFLAYRLVPMPNMDFGRLGGMIVSLLVVIAGGVMLLVVKKPAR
jgi:hypothetical protein